MRTLFTFLIIAAAAGSSYGQASGRPSGNAGEELEDAVSVVSGMDGRIPGTTLPDGRVVLPTFPKPEKPVTAAEIEQQFQQYIGAGDQAFERGQYADALTYYELALARKDDPYPRDQVVRAQAQQARVDAEEQARQADNAARSPAEGALAHFNEVHRVHITGGIMDDRSLKPGHTTLFVKDRYSNFLVPGRYDSLWTQLQAAGLHTLDGLVVPEKTRLVVYSEKNCKGTVLLDITGPAIVNNGRWKNDRRYKEANSHDFSPEWQAVYPQSRRSWSTTEMHDWINGSMEVIAE